MFEKPIVKFKKPIQKELTFKEKLNEFFGKTVPDVNQKIFDNRGKFLDKVLFPLAKAADKTVGVGARTMQNVIAGVQKAPVVAFNPTSYKNLKTFISNYKEAPTIAGVIQQGFQGGADVFNPKLKQSVPYQFISELTGNLAEFGAVSVALPFLGKEVATMRGSVKITPAELAGTKPYSKAVPKPLADLLDDVYKNAPENVINKIKANGFEIKASKPANFGRQIAGKILGGEPDTGKLVVKIPGVETPAGIKTLTLPEAGQSVSPYAGKTPTTPLSPAVSGLAVSSLNTSKFKKPVQPSPIYRIPEALDGDSFASVLNDKARKIGLPIKKLAPEIASKMDDADAALLEEFIDYSRLKQPENVELEIAARQTAEAMGINPDKPNGALANVFEKVLDEKRLGGASIVKEDDISTSIRKAKASGQSFDAWVKGRGEIHRGDATPLKLSEMDTTKVFNPAKKEALSAFHNTPGLYFTDSVSNAKSYGQNLTSVSINPTAKVINVNDAPKIIKRADVEKIIRSNPRIEDWAMNWDENFNKAIKNITDSVMAEKDGNEFLKSIWSDGGFSEGDFMIAMKKAGIDGIIIPKEGVNHFVIYNKDSLKTRSQLKAEWDKVNDRSTVKDGDDLNIIINDKPYGIQPDNGGNLYTREPKDLYNSPLALKFKKDGAFTFAGQTIHEPADVAFAFRQLKNEAIEKFYVVATKNDKPIAVELVSMGTLNASLVHPREVVGLLLQKKADGAYLVHNHPSGNIDPSSADIEVSGRMSRVMKNMGIELKGHVVIDTEKFGFIDKDGEWKQFTHKEASQNPKKVSAYKKYIEWSGDKAIAQQFTIKSRQDVYEIIKGIGVDDNNVLAFYLDARNSVITVEALPRKTIADGRLLKNAALNRAGGVILSNLKDEDSAVDLVQKQLKDLGIELIDVVVAKNNIGHSMVAEEPSKYSGIGDIKNTRNELIEKKKTLQESTYVSGELEAQFNAFKALRLDWDKIEDVAQLKKKLSKELFPGKIDNMLYSQDMTENEVFSMFKDWVMKGKNYKADVKKINAEIKSLPKIGKTIKEVSGLNRQRADKIKAIGDYFSLSSDDMKAINRRDVRYMDQAEFGKYAEDLKAVAEEFNRRKQKIAEVLTTIENKELKKTDNLRKALELPPIDKMTPAQLDKFNEELSKFQTGDEFMTPRRMELLETTKLKGAKVWREVRENLAKEVGANPEFLAVKADELDRFRGDISLEKRNPFYSYMVNAKNASLLKNNIEYYAWEKELDKLAKAAVASRKRGLVGRLIPQQEELFKFIESGVDDKITMMSGMTKEELELADFWSKTSQETYQYLVANNDLTASRFIDDNYIMHTRRPILEMIKDLPAGSIRDSIADLLRRHKVEERAFNILDTKTGEILAPKKFFANTLFRSGEMIPSKNAVEAMRRYMKTFYNKKALDEIVPVIETYAMALQPTAKTKRGMFLDTSLMTFTKEYLNAQKGRNIDFVVKQGGKLDAAIRAGRMFTSMLYLGLNIPTGLASKIGAQVSSFGALGNKKYLTGAYRMKTKQGKAILSNHKAFVGKSVWDDLFEVSKSAGDRTMNLMYGFFKDANYKARANYLLGEMTSEEFASGKLSPERLAEMKLILGRWLDDPTLKSLAGRTSFGKASTQFKDWAIPIIHTTLGDIAGLVSKLKNKKFKEAFTGQEIKEIGRILEVGIIAFIAYSATDQDDNSFLGRLKKKAVRELSTFYQALSPSTLLTAPVIADFIFKLGKNIEILVKMERYKTTENKGELKGKEYLKRQFTPQIIKQFTEEKKTNSNFKKPTGSLKEFHKPTK